MTELFIPCCPPSANAMWGFGRGRVFLSDAYKKWLRDAGLIINPQRPRQPIDGPYKLSVQIRRDTGADLDNLIKPLNDLLQKQRVVTNDKHCQKVTAEWVTFGYDGLYVQVEPA